MPLFGNISTRLYSGESPFNFVGNRKRWYIISGILLVVSIAVLLLRGLNLGVEFQGGAVYAVPSPTCSVVEAREATAGIVGTTPTVTETGAGLIRVQTEPLDQATNLRVVETLAATCDVPNESIGVQVVGPTWGAEITSKAVQALLVFLVLVTVFLSIYFEWRMAVAALVALAHDVIITVGIYSLTGLQVTPATVIGILTILGYSLYDTVVIFDKIKEDTRGITAQSMVTYGEAANRAVNQTLVRSVNTSITSLLPVLAIIVVGAGFLGAGTLLDLAVALAIGMAIGTYSSIFVAPPFLVQIKEKQPEIASLGIRVHARRAGQARVEQQKQGRSTAGSVVTIEGADDVAPDSAEPAEAAGGGGPSMGDVTIVEGPRTQPKRRPRSKRTKRD